MGVDKFLRRKWVEEVGSHSATPIVSMPERQQAFEEAFGNKIRFEYGDLRDYDFVEHVLEKYRPEYIERLRRTGKLDEIRRAAPSRRRLWVAFVAGSVVFSLGLGLLAVVMLAALGK